MWVPREPHDLWLKRHLHRTRGHFSKPEVLRSRDYHAFCLRINAIYIVVPGFVLMVVRDQNRSDGQVFIVEGEGNVWGAFGPPNVFAGPILIFKKQLDLRPLGEAQYRHSPSPPFLTLCNWKPCPHGANQANFVFFFNFPSANRIQATRVPGQLPRPKQRTPGWVPRSRCFARGKFGRSTCRPTRTGSRRRPCGFRAGSC